MHAARIPRTQQALEGFQIKAALEFRVQRVNLIAIRCPARQLEKVIDRILACQVGTSDQLIECRQGGRKLRHIDGLSVDDRDEGKCAACIGGVFESELPFEAGHKSVELPTRGTVDSRRPVEHLGELIARERDRLQTAA